MEIEEKVKAAAIGFARTFGPMAAEFMEAMEEHDWRRAEKLSVRMANSLDGVRYACSIMKQGQDDSA